VGGTGVADGCGVCVGGSVEVIMTSGVGVGVSGRITSALQAALNKAKTARMLNKLDCCGRVWCTILLYPRLGSTCGENDSKKTPSNEGFFCLLSQAASLPVSASKFSRSLIFWKPTTPFSLETFFRFNPYMFLNSLNKLNRLFVGSDQGFIIFFAPFSALVVA